MDAHPKTMRYTMQILKSYTQMTGLQINMQKSEFMPITVPHNLHSTIARILECPEGNFSFKYLELSMSLKRLEKEDFIPLFNKIQERLSKTNTYHWWIEKSLSTRSSTHFISCKFFFYYENGFSLLRHLERLK
jgi:hypothetical protein